MTWLRHPIALLAFTLFSGLFSLSLYSSWRRNQASGTQVEILEQQVTQMNQDLTKLRSEVQTASSAATQEKIIRDQLLMQKDGEQVFQIPENSGKNEGLNVPSPTPTAWREWQQVLFK